MPESPPSGRLAAVLHSLLALVAGTTAGAADVGPHPTTVLTPEVRSLIVSLAVALLPILISELRARRGRNGNGSSHPATSRRNSAMPPEPITPRDPAK